ncbi:MAG: cysteine hydrolase [Firmicutes bacterium]|nr:cysteine hydrolase [Bacillota bacterium]
MKIFIVVDMQNDFLRGTLPVKEAVPLIPEMVSLIEKRMSEKDTKVIFTRDTHQKNYLQTQEGKNLPVEHCIEGTWGHETTDEFLPFQKNAIVIDKPTFGSLDLPDVVRDLVKKHGKELEEIEMIGICSDICLINNAVILKAHFPEVKITIVEKLTAGITPETHEAALKVMKSFQINMV